MYHQHSTSTAGNPHIRDDALLETNFSDDEVHHTRGICNTNRTNNGIVIYNRRRSTYRSDQSVDRYTDRGNGNGRHQLCFPPFIRISIIVKIAGQLKYLSTSVSFSDFTLS